jgi:hypothetical protein
MTFTKDFHVTLAFLKKNAAIRDACPIIKAGHFIEDKQISVSVKALVVVPGKIATLLVDINDPNVKSENLFAHITLMTGGQWKPVHSNDILKALFSKEIGLLKD